MADFMGEYNHKIDAKGRVIVPPKFANKLSTELVVTLNPKGECLYIFEEEHFNVWIERFFAKDGGFDQNNPQHEKARSILKRRAHDIKFDSAGRILIPTALREKAGLKDSAMFIGNTNYIEIWDPEAREVYESDIDLAGFLYNAN